MEHLHAQGGGEQGLGLAIPRLPFTRIEAQEILASAPRIANFEVLSFDANLPMVTSGKLNR